MRTLVISTVVVWLMVLLTFGCTIRKYEVKVYAMENSHVTISPEIFAEVPHTTTIEAEGTVDLPDAQVIGQ